MKIPDSLHACSQPMQVKQKTSIGFMRYEFGTYRLIDGKARWTGSTRGGENNFLSNLLSSVKYEKETVNEKASFKLLAGEKDTVFVNIAIATVKNYERGRKTESGTGSFQSASQEYFATVQTRDTSNTWVLSISIKESGGGLITVVDRIKGRLVKNDREIKLVTVSQYEDGKKPPYDLGFVFEENNRAVAAVQYRGLAFKQNTQSHIWISSELDLPMQQILAGAATALLAKGHEMMSSTLEDAGPPK